VCERCVEESKDEAPDEKDGLKCPHCQEHFWVDIIIETDADSNEDYDGEGGEDTGAKR
jgi:hypothetical protein